MNYLQLVQRLSNKAGAGGDGASSVVGQKGEALRFVNWIDEAWVEIQNLHTDWSWMHKTASGILTPSTMVYSSTDLGLSSFGAWDLDDVKLYDVSISDEKFLAVKRYDVFKRIYGVGAQIPARPGFVSKDRDNSLVFGAIPDKAYTYAIGYYEAATNLVSNTDVPALPEQYHMLIVYKALEYYGRYENAAEVVGDGMMQFAKMVENVEYSQLPELTIGRPLV